MFSKLFKKQDINEGIDDYKRTGGAVLLDVRTKDEYRYGHVPGSQNLDVGMINTAPSIISDKQTPIFVYCQSGARSARAANELKRMGYSNIKDIGGISSYKGAIEKDG